MLRRFCEMQNLFSLSTTLPEALQALTGAFVHRFRPNIQGTLITDSLAEDKENLASTSSTQISLDEETASLLSEWKLREDSLSGLHTPSKATYHRRARYNGPELKPSNVSFPDSLVVIGTEETWSAAQIESIFDVELYPNGEKRVFSLLKVRYFEEMTAEDVFNDIYRQFDGMGRVVYVEGECRKEVVSTSSVISNFAMTETVLPKIRRRHAHVLPLFRVSETEVWVLQYTKLTRRAGMNMRIQW